ncbi:unnamed protein product, partial [Mycena citricolor]
DALSERGRSMHHLVRERAEEQGVAVSSLSPSTHLPAISSSTNSHFCAHFIHSFMVLYD